MPDRTFYVSWVDKQTDPWPLWERLKDRHGPVQLDGRELRFLPADHAQWPSVPYVEGADVPTVSDGRMGQYRWPGIPFRLDSRQCRLLVGPTVSALFHPESRFHDLKDVECAYFLHQPDSSGSPHAELVEACLRICEARGIRDGSKRLKLIPIAGIPDPTDHAAIIRGIEHWLNQRNSFGAGDRPGKGTTRIVVNLSPGTPAMHACWLMLRWNGSLGGAESVVEYVQGSGGLEPHPVEGPNAGPLRVVPIDVLSQLIGRKEPEPSSTPDADEVELEKLKAPFDVLRQKMDQAALLGLPILLQGERGTGKTFLAHYYHRRRQHYRAMKGAKPATAPRKSTKKPAAAAPERASETNFVPVTLSEFGSLDMLRDTLFGWAKGAWNRAYEAYDGLLGEAHGGTLFLDEVHHLARPLQASLLGPLNNGRYRPMMATYELTSDFDLVVATNDPEWRQKLADDFRDRLERIVLEVPSFRSFQRYGLDSLWLFWRHTLKRRCAACGIEYLEGEKVTGWEECREQLEGVFRRHPLPGNWRDLQRLADNVLLHMTDARNGRPTGLGWSKEKLERAIGDTFGDV
jgi:hypothetical protein